MMIVKLNGSESYACQSNDSILEGALKAGLVLEYSCKNGQCGVCKTTILDGLVTEIKPQLSLTEEDKKSGKCLTCCCSPETDILIDAQDLTVLKNIEIKTMPVRIDSINKLSDQIIQVKLRYPPRSVFTFVEGQYIDVLFSGIRRSYSVASTNEDNEILLLIKKVESGVMSDYWFNEAKENDLLRVEGPKGTFYLRDNSQPILMLGTGTGIAPLISILESLDKNTEFQQVNPIKIFWGNRYQKEFFWEPQFNNIKVDLIKVLSKSDMDWDGYVGYVQNIADDLFGSEIADFDVYACGSNNMIISAKDKFIKLGLLESKFYSDAFVQSY